MADIKLRIIVEGKELIPAAMQQASAAVEDASKRVNASMGEARGAAQKFGQTSKEEFHKAKDSVDLLSHSIGLGIPRELKKVIAGLPAIQGALSAAFSVVAIVGFVQILSQIPDLINKAIEKITGWDEAARAAFQRSLDMNRQLVEALEDQKIKLRELSSVGLEGSARQVQDQKNLQRELAATQQRFDELTRMIAAQTIENEELKKSHASLAVVPGAKLAMDHITGATAQIKENEERIDRLKKEQADKKLKLLDLETQTAKITAETAATQKKETLSIEQARIDAEARVNASAQAAAEAMANSRIALADMTADQEAQIHRELEQKKHEDHRGTLEKRLARALEMASQDPAGSAAAAAKINADIEAEESRHQAALNNIRTQTILKSRSALDALKDVEIASRKSAADQQFAIDRAFIAQQEAQHRLSIDEARGLEEVAANTKYQKDRENLEQSLALAREFPERNKAQILALQHELEALEIVHQADLTAIREIAAAKQQEVNNRIFEMRMDAARRAADFELEQQQRIINQKVQTSGGRESSQLEAIQHWYAQQRTILEESLVHARQVYGETHINYRQLLAQMNQLDRERLAKVQAVQDEIVATFERGFDRINDNFLGNLQSWALGQQTFKQALANTWNDIVLDLATTLARMGLRWVAHWALVNLLHVGAKSQQVAAEAAAAAATHAIISSANVGKVISDAAVAGAAGFASVMQALPFPANLAVAPGVASSSFAATAAFAPLAAFERGGIVTATDIALLHKNEMVLPAGISEGLQKAFSGSGTGAGAPPVHIHFHGPVDRKTVNDAERKLADAVRRAYRNGHFSSADLK